MSEETTETTETLRMCMTCGRMHSLRAQNCGTCRRSFEANGSRTRRLARDGADTGLPLFEVPRRPLSRAPGTGVSRRVIPRRGIVRQRAQRAEPTAQG